jgi:[acyl-carrier-protein] S-malonyltransferase
MGLDESQVVKMCRWVETESGLKPLEAANFNAPGQIVISGRQSALDWLKANFNAESLFPEVKRFKLIPLQVSAPFHCTMMKPAEDKMREVLGSLTFHDSRWAVIQNVNAEAVQDADVLRENLIRQISGAVRWIQCMEHLKMIGAKPILECGHGRVLTGLAKKIDSEQFNLFNVNSLEDIATLEKFLKDHGGNLREQATEHSPQSTTEKSTGNFSGNFSKNFSKERP